MFAHSRTDLWADLPYTEIKVQMVSIIKRLRVIYSTSVLITPFFELVTIMSCVQSLCPIKRNILEYQEC